MTEKELAHPKIDLNINNSGSTSNMYNSEHQK